MNEVVREKGFGGLRMTSRKYEPGHPQYGSVAFVTTETDLTYQTKWSREGWFDELQRFWDGFSGTGVLTDDDAADPSPEGRTDIGSLGTKLYLEEVRTYLPDVGEVSPMKLMPREKKDVVGQVLKGGTKITIAVTGEWYDGPTTEIEVEVDGNVTVVLTEHPHTVGAILVPLKYHITYG